MELRELEGRRVRLVDIDGKVYEGLATDYTFPEDNEPEEESITLIGMTGFANPIEFRASEIKSIQHI